jgi:hypothetical protein
MKLERSLKVNLFLKFQFQIDSVNPPFDVIRNAEEKNAATSRSKFPMVKQ